LVAVAVVMFAEIHAHADALVYWALTGSLGAGIAPASASGSGGSVSRQEMAAIPALFVGLTLLVVVNNVQLFVVVLVPFAAVLCSAVIRLICAHARGALRQLTLEYLGRRYQRISVGRVRVWGVAERARQSCLHHRQISPHHCGRSIGRRSWWPFWSK